MGDGIHRLGRDLHGLSIAAAVVQVGTVQRVDLVGHFHSKPGTAVTGTESVARLAVDLPTQCRRLITLLQAFAAQQRLWCALAMQVWL
jgi:hypothetical protein